MSENEVWLSNVLVNSNIIKGTKIEEDEPGWSEFRAGEMVSDANLPLKMYPRVREETYRQFGDVFIGAGGLKVKEGIANVIGQFDLGPGKLAPVQLYLYDRETAVDLHYWVCPIKLAKDGFLPAESPKARSGNISPAQPPPSFWRMPWRPMDGEIAVKASVLEGADWWHDLGLMQSLFVRGTVVKALKEKNLDRHFNFTRCRVIWTN